HARLGAPAVRRPQADRFLGAPERVEAQVGRPTADRAGPLVVTVMRGGARVDGAVRADADLDPLPVVAVVALPADDRDAAQRRRVGVIGPVLDVEVAGPGSRAVGALGLGSLGAVAAAIDHVDEGRDGQARVSAAYETLARRIAAGRHATAAEVDGDR